MFCLTCLGTGVVETKATKKLTWMTTCTSWTEGPCPACGGKGGLLGGDGPGGGGGGDPGGSPVPSGDDEGVGGWKDLPAAVLRRMQRPFRLGGRMTSEQRLALSAMAAYDVERMNQRIKEACAELREGQLVNGRDVIRSKGGKLAWKAMAGLRGA